jgi:predicted transcriptional regulator
MDEGETLMSVLTIRLPDAKHARLKELAAVALAQQDAQTRFALRASRGDVARGLAALDQLDAALGSGG